MSVLELRDVSFAYTSSKLLLDSLNLAIESHERVALHAPSGFGKTTVCRLLAGYLKPQQGSILLDGEPLEEKGNPCPVQMIWQHPEHTLDPLLRMQDSLEEAGSIDDNLLRQLGIKDEWLTRYPRELSGGELQRFCIARALRTHPAFLIADEISTMLDAITQTQIWKFLLSYCSEHHVGMVLVTHSESLQNRLATRVVNLAKS